MVPSPWSINTQVGIQASSQTETAGTVALAYAAHKAASPIRFPPTVALTPFVANAIVSLRLTRLAIAGLSVWLDGRSHSPSHTHIEIHRRGRSPWRTTGRRRSKRRRRWTWDCAGGGSNTQGDRGERRDRMLRRWWVSRSEEGLEDGRKRGRASRSC